MPSYRSEVAARDALREQWRGRSSPPRKSTKARRHPRVGSGLQFLHLAIDQVFGVLRITRASGLNLMAAPLFGTITRSNHTIRKGFTEM